MICRLSGRLLAVGEQTVVLELSGVCYELLTPIASGATLRGLVGGEITFHTVQYLEGSLGGGNLTPRLLGFLSESDRAFFHALTRVKGVSTRKALRAMSVATHQIAAGIERGDARFLSTLPEIGKKTAAQMIIELRGKLAGFLSPAAASDLARPMAELTDGQRAAVEVLVRWGDRRADAERWVAAVVKEQPELGDAGEIVRAAYRVKRAASG